LRNLRNQSSSILSLDKGALIESIRGWWKKQSHSSGRKACCGHGEKNPEWHCRKIAYQLEKKATVFVGKTKVAEIMKKHGLNHLFEQNIRPPMV
jgi:hypothetical protein